jgi:lipopolysaccharide transport system ATP-binding protein
MNVISVRELSKEFGLGGPHSRYRTLRERLTLFRNSRVSQNNGSFLALDKVSFDVRAGEAIGIIGRNGAGKSTLLKILARILCPSAGRVELAGRVGSLLEVGSGFHPELTGRENIFLSASIMGMNRREVLRTFDAIVDFAEVGQFLGEPVKRYSSGMYMRLAFSVAAHFRPEILLVDEVLAVGDAHFQKKCLRRIEQVAQNGQTVLFVSHGMESVMRLCNRALLLEKGRLVKAGPVHEVAAFYLEKSRALKGECFYEDSRSCPGDDIARLRFVRIRSRAGDTLGVVGTGQEFGIEMEFEVRTASAVVFPVFSISNQWGTEVLWSTDAGAEWHGRARPKGRFSVIAWIPPSLLAAGEMRVTAAMYSLGPRVQHYCEPDAIGFQVVESASEEGARGKFTGQIRAATMPRLHWAVAYRPRPCP